MQVQSLTDLRRAKKKTKDQNKKKSNGGDLPYVDGLEK